MNDKYTPGRHLLLTLQVEDVLLLTSLDPFLEFTKDQIKVNHLNIVGTSTHTFQGGGFTAAICLMESHICIHTWPEFGQLTLDIYLCNYLKDNSDKVFRLGSLFKDYFNAVVINETVVDR